MDARIHRKKTKAPPPITQFPAVNLRIYVGPPHLLATHCQKGQPSSYVAKTKLVLLGRCFSTSETDDTK